MIGFQYSPKTNSDSQESKTHVVEKRGLNSLVHILDLSGSLYAYPKHVSQP